ncbi:hypothetical protein R5R35_013475 [Gryllus longicercus]|uniref:ATP-binding cassette sub-family G member 4 n=1 Tax=Gryllus longicercus TaxID=2509291 RepID=A0AAN9VGY6_9ORTH
MNMAAYLKLGNISSEVRNFQINTILDTLGLAESENTQAVLLSGGQRKRLAIALELINNPPVMFFDEPTSGLDSSSSWHCIELLKRLAQGGRTVVCSIHQPSALLFEQFDTLYALGDGRCMYQGYVTELLPHLSRHNFICPAYHNPADFLLEVLVGEHGPTNSLAQSTEVKKANDTSLKVPSLSEISLASEEGISNIRSCDIPHPATCESIEEFPKESSQPSLILQLRVLLHRNYLIYIRDPFLTQTRIVMHAMIGLFIGMLYYDIGNDAAYVMDNFGFLYFCIMFIQFTAFSSKLLSFPFELPILMREYFNGWYSLKSYFLAGVAADAPVQVLCTLSYILVSYYLTSQPPEIHRLFLLFYVVLLVGLISQVIGVLTGLTMGMQNGMVFGPLAILPFLIFSGFFVSMKDAPKYFEWLFHMSYLKYGLEAVMQAMYSYDREKLPCSTDYCHFKLPMKFLEELHMVDAKYWVDIIFLTLLYIVLLAVTYTVLKVKLRRR